MSNIIADEALMDQITSSLLEFGAKPQLYGFRYLNYAISMAIHDNTYLHDITYRLYNDVAQACGTTSYSVERCIRTLIKNIWKNGNREILQQWFGKHQVDCPSNGHFIGVMVQRMMLK